MVVSSTKEVFLIDASAFIFRAYYALAPLSSKGRPSHAVAGFASTLLKLLREKEPKSCIIVFDSKKPSFRKEIYPEYKANREIPPPDLSGQIVAVREMCEKAGFPILQEEGMEADDWIASFVLNSFPKEKVLIVSSDKDLAQLVDKRVNMYDSFKDKRMSPKEVEQKFGVKPEQIRDYLALVGDASDNIPGVPGIGPKTASKLLQEYKDIDGIYKNLDKLPKKQGEKFNENKKQLSLSRELVSLKADLDVPFDELQKLEFPLPKALSSFLDDWDCTRVLSQFEDILEAGAASKRPELKLELIKTKKQLDQLVKEIKKSGSVAFDCETNSFNRDNAEVVGVSFSIKENEAFYIPWHHGDVGLDADSMESALREILENEAISKCAHNGKYDIQVLGHHGIQVKGFTEDTMLLGHLLNADRRSVSLDNLAKDFLGEEKGDLKALLDGSEDFSTVPLEKAVDYAAKDSALTLQLLRIFEKQIKDEPEIDWIYRNIEIPLVETMARMEDTGVLIDTSYLKDLSKEMHKELKKIEKQIYDLAGHEFNIASPKQLQAVLFEELGLPPIKKTKTGYSTNESVLKELALQHELPQKILEQRKIAKLTSTYVDVLPNLVADKDKRLHTHYHQTGTATGRLSSSEPNLQNIPVRSEAGMKIRQAFIPAKGYSFLSADYSQVELRLMAHLSGDEKMIEAFQNHRDIHTETAKHIFGSEDKEHRSRAKAINFGVIYGISAFGLAQQLNITRKDAKDFIDSYFEEFPDVKRFMEEAVELAKDKLYSKTLFGRKRPLPDIKSKNPTLRAMAERIAINAPLQGTAADIMKYAMVRVDQILHRESLKSRVLLQVHDELVLEVKKGEEDQVKELVEQGMTDLSGTPGDELRVPLVVDLSLGDNWAVL